ncbi:hypothetical protein ACS0TY_008767 [Phlomoides rotata]
MGSCLSKKSVCATSFSSSPVAVPKPPEKLRSEILPEKKKAEEETVVKKEIFIIKHRRSHEIERQKSDEEKGEAEFVDKGKIASSSNGVDSGGGGGVTGGGGGAVRTSSCTKEEVDAILIQCGRLSRSSSTGKAAHSSENGGRKYSGSKRSYDFDHENGKGDVIDGDDDAVARERENRRRERRQSQGRRRTPSREREKDQAAQQRSGSRERGGSGGRRVSRSPGRRSESPITTTGSGANSNSSAANANSRPGKMVSVPATVPGSAEPTTTAVKRIQVKRNVGGTAASPRARSPARARASNENHNVNSSQQPSLSRSNSRKAEISPFRRNPLGEIDTNIISQAPNQKPNSENKTVQGSENRMNSNNQTNVAMNVISAGPENPKINGLARSRSSRLSRDLDISPETNTSYTALLLEDIQNFHQKNTTPPPFSLPPCVSKACSILEAVADLNSSIGSNLSTTLTDRNPITEPIPIRKMKQEIKDPILESEVIVSDDLMQPSFHKYVTVRRGTSGEEDELEEQESSGSNSFVSSQQQWASSSCWEPNSAESTDRWTSSSRSVTRTNDVSPVGFQRHTTSDDCGKKVIAPKKREFDHQQNGIGRGRVAAAGRDSGVGSR